MDWIKIKTYWGSDTGEHSSNVPYGKKLLVTNGHWVEYIEEHGWDNEEYYFHNGTGKLEGITHFMLLPKAPKE